MNVEINLPEGIVPNEEQVIDMMVEELVASAGAHVREYLSLGRIVARLKMEMDDGQGKFGIGSKGLVLEPGDSDLTDRIIRMIVNKIYEMAKEGTS